MRQSAVACLAVALILGCHARVEEESGPFDFRKTRWGMSRQQVLASEGEDPIYKSPSRILYATGVIGKRVMLEYHLGDDRLYRARYILVASHLIDDKYVADYRDFQSVLTAKYGQPKKNESAWKKGVGVRKDLQPGVSVAIGHLTLLSEWETPETAILATLSGREHKIQCQVTYTGKALLPLVEKYDLTDPALGGPGGEIGKALEDTGLEDATRDF